ncbi:hypothetical protein [Stenotrophomonas sp.]|uniref:hypothetical protein n=1 Tax=Stenotrophomonas sp. TaxID=69392 RepID=UPI0019A2B4DB|nr:hypothetical protein [Stenotrophomonas sp.]MBD3825635.1 hypothetical protein [Stenotrophomonas sp.]
MTTNNHNAQFVPPSGAIGNQPVQVGEVQGDAHVLVLREMRARLTDAGSPARTSALDAAIAALAATGKQHVSEESAGQPETCRSDRKAQVEQVGEVQGDALPALPYPNYPVSKTGLQNNLYTASQMQDYARAALAARQPVGAAEQLDRALGETIDQRDRYHEVADDLAGHIERITGVEIGEHSSDNCPWQNAIDAAESYTPAQGIDLDALQGVSNEYNAWIYFHAAGEGDYDDFLRKHVHANERDAAPGVGNG